MKLRYRVLMIGALVVILAMIRFFEHSLFYDPFLEFYQSDYLHNKLPNYELSKLLIHVFFRFFLITLVSLAIIYVAFQDKNILKFAVILYAILFIILIIAYVIMLQNLDEDLYQALFYLRRFLIHPLFIMIILPAFYYYRLQRRQSHNIKSIS